MGQDQNIFQRYEKKYMLNDGQYMRLTDRLSGRMQPDAYGKSTICNVYFDTPNRRLIRASLEKPIYKEKLRLRSYGVPAADTRVFAELKKKFRGVVYKRRIGMPLSAAETYLYRCGRPPAPCQITREIDWFLHYYQDLKPAMYLSYERTAFYQKEQTGLRITFDSNILWREEALSLSAGTYGQALLEPGQHLMEIKIPGALPLWLTEILDVLQIYPISFSKYGTAYMRRCGASAAAVPLPAPSGERLSAAERINGRGTAEPRPLCTG